MRIVPTFCGVARGGSVVFDKPGRITECLRGKEGKRVRVSVDDETAPRTNPQLRYLFGVVFKIISDHTGYTPIETRELMEAHFLKHAISGPENKEFMVTRSVGDLKKDEMSEFIEKVVRLASEHWSLYIPDPDEIEY